MPFAKSAARLGTPVREVSLPQTSRHLKETALAMDQHVERITLGRGPFGEIIEAVTPFETGETIFELTGEIIDHPTKYTIQLNEYEHVLTLDSQWKSMNHGCAPNVRIDTVTRQMVAARPIAAGAEMTFNYNSTEWSMTSPFPCGCGAPSCAQEIRGFRFLSPAQRETLRPLISPFIARRWAEEASGTGAPELNLRTLKPEIHLLIPYMIEDGQVVSPEYDLPGFHAELKDWFGPLDLRYVWTNVTIPTIDTIVAGLVERNKQTPIIVMNLCDGSEEDGYPGPSVVTALTLSGLPFSGASTVFYNVTTGKLTTKRLLQASGVSTAEFVVIDDTERDLEKAVNKIGYPLFIKPDVSAGSYGISLDSVCYDLEAARQRVDKLRNDKYFHASQVFAEPFIEGREFTALVIEDPSQPLGLYVLPPGERVFDQRVPANEQFLAYERYWELPEDKRPIPAGEPYYWYQSAPQELRAEIENLARRAVRAVDGSSYARADMRRSNKSGKLFILEVNANCGLSTDDSSTVGSLLKLAGRTMPEILELVLNHALTRNRPRAV